MEGCEVTTDTQCKEILTRLMNELPLSIDQKELLERCISAAVAGDNEDVSFGPGEILGLADLFIEYQAQEILACSDYLISVIDCEGDIAAPFYLKVADTYSKLGDIMLNNT